jgi:transposase
VQKGYHWILAEWKRIQHTEENCKPDMYGLIKAYKYVYCICKIDKTLAEHEHSVLQLPPYHPELNLIKLIWAAIKTLVAEGM